MAVPTECQTPGAWFSVHTTDRALEVTVHFSKSLNLNEKEARLLEANVHNALEMVLAKYYA
jgi:hypothetical protein